MSGPHFNGSDYVPSQDDQRLTAQHDRVKAVMKDHQWRTLREIADETGDPEASISAQLRHLRKERFGSHVLEKRSKGIRKDGLYEYRLMPPGFSSEHAVKERPNKYKAALQKVYREYPNTRQLIKDELGIK